VHVSGSLFALLSQRSLSQVVITRHVGDVLAAFIQVLNESAE
jgi:hypothetical protein